MNPYLDFFALSVISLRRGGIVKNKIIPYLLIFIFIISISVFVIFHKEKKEYVALCFYNTSVKLTNQFNDITKNLGYKETPCSFTLSSDSLSINILNKDKLNVHTNSKSNDTIQEVLYNYEYLKDFYRILTLSEADSEIISFGSNDVKCRVYNVIISKNDFKKFCDEVKTDNTYDYIHYKVREIATDISKKLGIEISESGINNILNSITPEKSNLYQKLKNDINVKLYIYKNCVCGLYTSIDFEGIDMANVIVDIKLGDGKKLLHHADIHFSCIIDGKKFFLNAIGYGNFDNADSMKLHVKGAITYNHVNFFDSELSIAVSKKEYTTSGFYKSSEKSQNIRGSGIITVKRNGIFFDYKNFNGDIVFQATIK